jgi:4-diphosphocytidyl-2-C-methyl-D-erythritol kinase
MNTEHVFAAPGKLNLFLHVIGRRPDGYHELQTLFRFIERADRIGLSVRSDGAIRRVNHVPGVQPESDLAVRAAQALQVATGCPLGADIRVEKHLPMGGGLGGGSSDAATVLLGLNHLWGTGLDRAALQALGLRLGADVPVFLFGRNAFAEGVGERLQAFDPGAAWYLVLTPPVAVSTAAVFASPHLTRHATAITIAALSRGWRHDWGRNDLQSVVRDEVVEVHRALSWLEQFGPARMTGSGACVFCGFETEAAARAALAQVPEGLSGFVARGLDEHPLRALAAD